MDAFLKLFVGVYIWDCRAEHSLIIKTLFQEGLICVGNNGKIIHRLSNPKPTQEEIDLGCIRGKIYAVKAYKDRTGKGIIDSKHAVERFFENNNLTFKKYE